ncbi:hypothetical protein [Capnocytophaga sp.]|uniref:hypothetical protein n=1 Tax=Capnocytophaga sp. TaxID=44737 RepID=UPI0026DC5439|nr:hypothetical protein [Capnocytophaga sp.]MDO5105262.1 hypothetical protein [Capnocytophaga sp.]
MISYFDKKKEVFFDFIKNGKIVPFYQISRFEYSIFIAINDENPTLPTGWREVYRYEDFFMQVGDLQKVCLASFSYLEYHLAGIKKNITDRFSVIPTGAEGVLEEYHSARGFDLPKGNYYFDLIGLEKIEKGKRESKNYGFAFVFRSEENAVNHNFTKCNNADNQYKFDIVSHLKK